MSSYELPQVDGMSSEQAGQAINKIMADCAGDSEHPYFDGNHAQSKDFVAVVTTLHQIKAKDSDQMDSLERGMQDGLDMKTNEQAGLVTKAKVIMASLSKLGYEETAIPADITSHRVEGLTRHRMSAEKAWPELVQSLSQDMMGLNPPAEILAAYQSLAGDGNMSDTFKYGQADDVIKWVMDKKKGTV